MYGLNIKVDTITPEISSFEDTGPPFMKLNIINNIKKQATRANKFATTCNVLFFKSVP
jgi:hypothetical protein